MRLPEHQHVETQLEVHFRRLSTAHFDVEPALRLLPLDTELIPPGRPHVGEWEDDSEVVVVLMPPLAFERAADEILVRSKFVIFDRTLKSEPLIHQLACSLRDQFHSTFGVSKLSVESSGYLLAEHILRNYAETVTVTLNRDRFNERDLREITGFVDQHLEGGVTVAEMAQVAKMGVHRFGRLLRLATGCTPYEFVQSRRFELAKTLLRYSPFSLAEIAFRLGFANQSHFTSVFRQAAQTSPNAYRKAVSGR